MIEPVYYNEFNLHAAAYLRNLIEAGHIADGVVDTRSIEDVRPSDLAGFKQCHFFAGVGVWSYALRAAGWPDNRPVWTGSCPCQPFSEAGKGAAFDDERHLWPAFHHLIKVGKPECILGEQVASKAVDPWIDLVHADLEALGYAFGSVPFPSAGVGAPHIRDRNYWVANAHFSTGRQGRSHVRGRSVRSDAQSRAGLSGIGMSSGLANDQLQQRQDGQRGISAINDQSGWQQDSAEVTGFFATGGLGNTQGERCGEARPTGRGPAQRAANAGATYDMDSGVWTGPTNGLWADADWLFCRDGKWRPVESGTQPLAHGDSARVGRLRAYGNAINAEAARVWIETVMECQP